MKIKAESYQKKLFEISQKLLVIHTRVNLLELFHEPSSTNMLSLGKTFTTLEGEEKVFQSLV